MEEKNKPAAWSVESVCQVQLTGVLVQDEDGNQYLQLWSDRGDKVAVIESEGLIDELLLHVT